MRGAEAGGRGSGALQLQALQSGEQIPAGRGLCPQPHYIGAQLFQFLEIIFMPIIFVNLVQARIIWGEGPSTEKMPTSDRPVGKSVEQFA